MRLHEIPKHDLARIKNMLEVNVRVLFEAEDRDKSVHGRRTRRHARNHIYRQIVVILDAMAAQEGGDK